MRRAFVTLLILLVQLQFGWGVAAPYCGHESGAAFSGHFGHHEHRHQAVDGQKFASVEKAIAFDSNHLDCESCHFGNAGTVVSAPLYEGDLPRTRPVSSAPIRYTSHVSAGPERPDRPFQTVA